MIDNEEDDMLTVDTSDSLYDDMMSIRSELSSICGGDNYLNGRHASVTGFSRSACGIVYYEITVECPALGPLATYRVRRRYSEFQRLHAALSKMMVSRESKANIFSPISASSLREVGLPSLPDKGSLWSYFKQHEEGLLNRRKEIFDEIIMAAQEHSVARMSTALTRFLGKPPDAVTEHGEEHHGYVSLKMYAAPQLRPSLEAQARREKAKECRDRRKQRSVSCPSLDNITNINGITRAQNNSSMSEE